MKTYKFNIEEYQKTAGHLTPLYDLTYRRMIDWCMVNESSLPNLIEDIGYLIRSESIFVKAILDEFWNFQNDGWHCPLVDAELERVTAKKIKARASAMARWNKYNIVL